MYEISAKSTKKGIKKEQFSVLTRIIGYDSCMGRYHDCRPHASNKWAKKNMYILYDASSIVDTVQKLSLE